MYWLLFPLHDLLGWTNLLRYITVRSGAAALTSFLFMLLVTPWFQARMRQLQFGQTIRADGPQTHQQKSGTPTMGGIVIFSAFLLSTLLWGRFDNSFVLLLLSATLAFVAIGFADDLLCLMNRSSKGLSGKMRLFLELVLVVAVVVALRFNVDWSDELWVPFFKDFHPAINWLYLPLAYLVIAGTANGVNLADGLDGLAAGLALPVLAALAFLGYACGHVEMARYLLISYSPSAGEITVLVAALAGSVLGFLWYNSYPASLFMGDTGSLGIGGFIGLSALLIKQELLLPILCGMFALEVLSVILQVGSFKLTGKRIFKMAPLHHHFELSGWPESKVIARFWIVGVLFALLALISMKVR